MPSPCPCHQQHWKSSVSHGEAVWQKCTCLLLLHFLLSQRLASPSPLWQQPPVSGYPCHPEFPAFTCSMTSNANTNDLTQCTYRWENVGQKRHCASVLLCTPVCLCFCLFCLSLCLSLCQPCSHHSRLRLEMKPSANPAENQQVNSPVPGTPSRTVASWRTLT